MSKYRINVRFDLDRPTEAKAAQYLQSLDKSRNAFKKILPYERKPFASMAFSMLWGAACIQIRVVCQISTVIMIRNRIVKEVLVFFLYKGCLSATAPCALKYSVVFKLHCVPDNDFVKRSRRMVHIRHHCTDIDKVTAWRPVSGSVCLDCLTHLGQILIFLCSVNMAVEHICSIRKTRSEERNGIMAHHNMLAAVLDFL